MFRHKILCTGQITTRRSPPRTAPRTPSPSSRTHAGSPWTAARPSSWRGSWGSGHSAAEKMHQIISSKMKCSLPVTGYWWGWRRRRRWGSTCSGGCRGRCRRPRRCWDGTSWTGTSPPAACWDTPRWTPGSAWMFHPDKCSDNWVYFVGKPILNFTSERKLHL